MNRNKKQIWAYLSMKKGMYDNDYYFFDDGTILHHYDRSLTKLNLESYVLPYSLSDSEKERIISKCESECSEDIVKQIKNTLVSLNIC